MSFISLQCLNKLNWFLTTFYLDSMTLYSRKNEMFYLAKLYRNHHLKTLIKSQRLFIPDWSMVTENVWNVSRQPKRSIQYQNGHDHRPLLKPNIFWITKATCIAQYSSFWNFKFELLVTWQDRRTDRKTDWQLWKQYANNFGGNCYDK